MSQPLTPAAPDDLEQALAHALQLNGHKQFKTSHELTAKITAGYLAEHLRRSGFVVMKKPVPPLSLAKVCEVAAQATNTSKDGA